MKTLGLKMMGLFFLMVGGIAVNAQQRQDVPGDDFSLEGALELFKQSASPEEFERKLNSPEAKVNNLDLNTDGEIDYIRVIDRNEGNVHAFILQAVLSNSESQDVAVIELEKLANGKAVLQITGDEDVYGIETIIEPTEEVRINAGTSTVRNVVNVWTWPSVQYVYSPYYRVWVSPWHWYDRPYWWSSWRPVNYYDYYSYWYPYRNFYAPCYTHRVMYAHTMYRPYRTYSSGYYSRYESRIVSYRSNHHNEHSDYGYEHDRNNRTNYSTDRTNRGRYEGKHDYNTEHTPVVRERSNSDDHSRSTMNTPMQREHKQNFERKPETRHEHVYTDRSEVRNKPTEERSYTHSDRSAAIHKNQSSEQHEVRSFDKPERSRSDGGEVKRFNDHGNGNGNGRGDERSNGRSSRKRD